MFAILSDGEEYLLGGVNNLKRTTDVSVAQEVSFSSIEDGKFNPAYPHIQEESIIKFPDNQEYRIKTMSQRPGYKICSAVHIVTDLSGVPFDYKITGRYDLEFMLSSLFIGTGWTVNVTDPPTDEVVFADWGRNNVWALFLQLRNMYKFEFIVLPNKVIEVSAKITENRGKQYRYGYNVKNIGKEVSTTNLATRMIVKYSPGLMESVTYVSPLEASYGRIIYAPTVEKENILNAQVASEYARMTIIDVPQMNYTIDVAEIGNDVKIGETVYTIYEPLDDLNIETRAIKLVEEWDGDSLNITDVTIGNVIFATAEEELMNKITQNEQSSKDKDQELENKIKDSENRYNVRFDILEDRIESEVTDLETNMTSLITQTAYEIRSEVSAQFSATNSAVSSVTQTANSLQTVVTQHTSELNNLNGRMSSAESSITQTANEISTKVSYSDYTGNQITSRINQTATTISIQADKINLNGATIVNGHLTGNGNVSITNDAYIGRNLYMQGSGNSRVQFADASYIQSQNGTMSIDAWNTMNIFAPNVNVGGVWNFNSATLVGVAAGHTSGIGIAWSSAINRLYVRINGANVGHIDLET